MAKITINPVSGSYASVTAFNARMQQIEDAFNNNTLWRDGFVGEPNQMEVALDMNSKAILNLPEPATATSPVRLQELTDLGIISSITESVTVASKAVAVSLTPTAGQTLYILSEDGRGNIWQAVVGAAPGTHSDNGGVYCGTVFIPTGGDGSEAWIRDYENNFNVKWFGAVGDGTTDDTTAIQDAFDTAFAKSGFESVYFPSGEYIVSSTIDMSRVSMYGDPAYSRITASGAITGYVFDNDETLIFGETKPIIENLLIDCNSLCGGIHTGVRHHTFHRLKIINADATTTTVGIYLERNTQVVSNCIFERCGTAIKLDGTSNATVAASVIAKNQISVCDIGIWVNEAQSMSIKDNVIQTCETSEIYLASDTGADLDGIVIRDNYFENQTASHLRFIHLNPLLANDIEGLLIDGNYFYGTNNTGEVAIEAVENQVLTITNNFFRAVPYVLSVCDDPDSRGIYEGNVHSTNVFGVWDPADTVTEGIMDRFRFGNNKGFLTRNSGNAVILSGTTSIAVTFAPALDVVPTSIMLSFGDATAGGAGSGNLYWSSATVNGFTLHISGAAANNIKVHYQAYFGEI